jgi:formate dehydrogenase subunit gamma
LPAAAPAVRHRDLARYFSFYFPIGVIRAAAVVHAAAAFVLIAHHRAHLRGVVGQGLDRRDGARHRHAGLGRKHHPKWFRESVK